MGLRSDDETTWTSDPEAYKVIEEVRELRKKLKEANAKAILMEVTLLGIDMLCQQVLHNEEGVTVHAMAKEISKAAKKTLEDA